MHEEMIEQIAEERGYDRGFTAGTKHAHDLISHYIKWVKQLSTIKFVAIRFGSIQR